MQRDELIKGVEQYFSGYTPRFFVTLNTKIIVHKPHEIELKSIAADRKVGVMMGWLKEYCMGKSRTNLMRAYAFYEAGKQNGVLHAHVIVAMNGETARTLDNLSLFVGRKWKNLRLKDYERSRVKSPYPEHLTKLRNMMDAARSDKIEPWDVHLDTNTDIREVHSLTGASNYSMKDFVSSINLHQFCNAMPH